MQWDVLRLTEETGEQGNKDEPDQRDAAARHELLNTLRLSTGVVVAVALQKVDAAPDTQAGTEGDDEGLEHIDCTVEKIHNILPESNGIEADCYTPDCKIRNENRRTCCACVNGVPIPASPFKF